ncbi:MAG TPA: hypothetical protein PKO25_12835, partial [Spirochaetota bacterium]|nr:hypothetical protein [Spirochaetota bacterium]HPV99028.1 hypothetical protein [Spirochaetota bacterium]
MKIVRYDEIQHDDAMRFVEHLGKPSLALKEALAEMNGAENGGRPAWIVATGPFAGHLDGGADGCRGADSDGGAGADLDPRFLRGAGANSHPRFLGRADSDPRFLGSVDEIAATIM